MTDVIPSPSQLRKHLGGNFKEEFLSKEVVVSKPENYTIDGVSFEILSHEDTLKYAEMQVHNREMYVSMTSKPHPFGVLDLRLGAHKNDSNCATCGSGLLECPGHWGCLMLHAPIFHVGYFKHLIHILYCICKRCSTLLLQPEQRNKLLRMMRRSKSDPIIKRAIFTKIVGACKKTSKCPNCFAHQGTLKRIVKPALDQFMKIHHIVKYKEDGKLHNFEEILNPIYVSDLLKRMNAEDWEVLDVVQPEKLLISSLLIPPNCIRPSVTMGEQGSTEDDLTVILSDIVELNNIMRTQRNNGFLTNQYLGNWEFLQLQCTRLINSEAPAVAQLLASKNIAKPGRGICQRLKGKEGRFRCNLSGKRVDFSGRTVISPDPNVGIQEVVVPEWMAKRLTFPERVCSSNIDKLRSAVLRGCEEWPGAAYVNKLDGSKSSLRFANRRLTAENLQPGDIVERHLWNGDVVLFNRQPSLHRLSIMAHKARVMKWRTLRFNECVCSPYNADFDGDEMNIHLPQTEEAKAEAYYLMNVVNNLKTPKNGEPLIAPTQDFLSASYMLTHKDVFLTRDKFCTLCSHFSEPNLRIDIPPPAILKPIELWTGKQVISVLLQPNKKNRVMVNFEIKEREYSAAGGDVKFMCPKDAYAVFYKSELLAGAIGKRVLGNVKFGLFHHLICDNNAQAAAACMGRIARLTSRWFADKGMTIGIDDVTPSPSLIKLKQELLDRGYENVSKEIQLYQKGAMEANTGSTIEQTLEVRMKFILDDLRNQAGKACNTALKPSNKPLIMFNSGAKGALINLAQMIACVGQQNVWGQRIHNGFVNRSLPHFPMNCKDAKSRGFVANSFYSGLQPDEFFFHTMSGREGLVDTAVKTSETGYMQRRLMKALEDLSVCYDYTVRTSDGHIAQFVYGDDGLNPIAMESLNRPFSMDKVFTQSSSMIPVISIDKLSTLINENRKIGEATTTAAAEVRAVRTSMRQRGKRSIEAIATVKVENSVEWTKFCVLPPSDMTPIASLIDLFLMEERRKANPEDERKPNPPKKANPHKFVSSPPASLLKKLKISKRQDLATSDDPMSRQVYSNLEAHMTVYEWLPYIKQNVPLLPYEITQWSNYLLERTADLLPQPPIEHQAVAIKEEPTHQNNTETVKVFQEELREWLQSKSGIISAYRSHEGECRAEGVEEYNTLLKEWDAEGCGFQKRLWMGSHETSGMCETEVPNTSLRTAEMANDSQIVSVDVSTEVTKRPRLTKQEKNEPSDMGGGSEKYRRRGKWKVNREYWVSVRHIIEFLKLCWRKFLKAICEPGEAVGAIGAQSIGEPGTQMTLKTFHFAGVASMNVTLGVPRIKEIINATNKILTPIIEVPLSYDGDYNYALMVKGRIEKTLLSECCLYIKEVYTADGAWLAIKICQETIAKLFLNINSTTVKEEIMKNTSINKVRITKNSVEILSNWKLRVKPPGGGQIFFQLQALKAGLLKVVLSGSKDVKRGVIKREEKKMKDGTPSTFYGLAVEGYGLRDVMTTPGVVGTSVTSNHVMEVCKVLGIEAARSVIVNEIRKCMDAYSMDIDCRHMTLLGDVMTFRGEVLGINRFGIQKMRASTLMLASFEETNEHLFEAAVHHRKDSVKGVSECIIVGKPIALGTGMFDIMHQQPAMGTTRRSTTVLAKYGSNALTSIAA